MVTTSNLISYFQCEDNAANTTVVDIHASNDGTASTNTSNMTTTGKINNGLDFDGSSDVVTIPSAVVDLTAGTISMWVNLDSAPTTQWLFSEQGTANNNNEIEVFSETNQWKFTIWNGTTPSSILFGDTTDTGVWHHVVVSWDATNMTTYIDNVKSTQAHAGMPSVKSTLYLMSRSGGVFFNDGKLDEIAFFNTKLSDSDVSDLWNSGNALAYPFTVGTNLQLNISDVWKDVPAMKINIGDVWKDVASIKLNIGDVWKDVF